MADNTRIGHSRDEHKNPPPPKFQPQAGQGRGGVANKGWAQPAHGSLADHFKSFTGGVVNSVTNFAAPYAAYFTGQAISSATPIQYQSNQMTAIPVQQGAQLVGKALNKAAGPILAAATAYDEHIWKPWSKALATTITTGAAELGALQDGNFLNPGDVWQRAWDQADRSSFNPITPGQATEFFMSQIPGVRQLIVPHVAHVENIFDPFEREKYKTNPLLKWSTGALDLAGYIFADPTVVGGKVLKTARLATLAPKIDATRGIFLDAEQKTLFDQMRQATVEAETVHLNAQDALHTNRMGIAETSNQMRAVEAQINEIKASGDLFAGLDAEALQKTLDDLNLQRKALETERGKLQKDFYKSGLKVEEVKAKGVPTAAAGPAEFVNQVVNFNMSESQIMNHYIIKRFGTNAGNASSIIAAAAKGGDKALVMDAVNAMYGDVNSYARLFDQAPVVHEMIRRSQGDLSYLQTVLESMKIHGGDIAHYVAENKQMQARIGKELDDLLIRDKFLSEAVMSEGKYTPLMRNQLRRGFARYGNIEEFRANRARSSAALEMGYTPATAQLGWVSKEYRLHHLARPVVHLQWIGSEFGKTLPHGWVATHGMNESEGILEHKAWLQSVREFTPQQREQFLNEFIAAGQNRLRREMSIGDLRSQILLNHEREAVIATAKSFNPQWARALRGADGKILRNADGSVRVYADEIWDAYQSKRAAQIRAFKESKLPGKKGYGISEDGKILRAPVLDSQLEFSHPMLHIGELTQALGEKAFSDNLLGVIDTLKYMPPKVAATKAAEALYTAMDRVWRPAVLLRLGYTQRNVMEAWLRTATHFGGQMVFMAPYVAKGAKNFALNRWSRFDERLFSLQQWKEFAQNGIDIPKVPPFVWGRSKLWSAHLEDTMVMQQEELAQQRMWHESLQQATKDEALADIADAEDAITGIKHIIDSKKKAGMPVEADLTESLRDHRNKLKIAKQRLADAEDDSLWIAGDIIDANQARLDFTMQKFRDWNTQMTKLGSKENRAYGGVEDVPIGHYDFPGIYSDTAGRAARGEVSADSRNILDSNTESVISLDSIRAVGDRWERHDPPRFNTGRTPEEITGHQAYWSSLERAIHQLRNDSLGEVLLREYAKHPNADDAIDAAITAGEKWLTKAEGRSYIDRVKSIGEFDPTMTPQAVASERMQQIFDHAAGEDAIIRQMATDKNRILGSQLRRDLFNNENTVPVHGQQIQTLREIKNGRGYYTTFKAGYNTIVQKAFKYLGSLPEDTLVRHPFAQLSYNRSLAEQSERLMAQNVTITQEMMDTMVSTARQIALNDVRKTLYTIMRKSAVGQKVSWLSPFIQAQNNSLLTWSRLLYENPEQIGRLEQAWRNLDKLGTVEKDPNTGETMLTFRVFKPIENAIRHVSPAMAEALKTYSTWALPKAGINLLAAGWRGDDLTTQLIQTTGIGPVVQIPVGWWIRSNPQIDQDLYRLTGQHLPAREILSKFVPDDQLPRENNWLAAITNPLSPAWMRNLTAAAQGDDSYRFAEAVLTISMNKLRRQNLGDEPVKSLNQIYKESEHEATMFMFVRTAANLVLPIVPRYETALQPYITQLRDYQNKFGNREGFAKFVEENPQMWYLNASLTSNPSGMDSTTKSVFLAKRHKDLVDRVAGLGEEYVSMVTDTETNGKFDVASNLWKRGSGFTARKNPLEALKLAKVAKGWLDYHKMKENINGFLAQNNLTSIQQAPELADRQRTYIQQLKESNPEWYDAYNNVLTKAWIKNVQAAREVAFNPAVVRNGKDYEHMKFVRAYFSMRDNIQKQLENYTRDMLTATYGRPPTLAEIHANSPRIDSKIAESLRVERDAYVKHLKLNPMFAQFYDRWLDSDQFTYVPEGEN